MGTESSTGSARRNLLYTLNCMDMGVRTRTQAGCGNRYEGAGYGTDVNHDIDGTVRKNPTVARIFDCGFYSKI